MDNLKNKIRQRVLHRSSVKLQKKKKKTEKLNFVLVYKNQFFYSIKKKQKNKKKKKRKKERIQNPSRTKKKRSLMPSFEAFEQVVEILLMMKRKYRIHGNKNIYRTP